MHPRLHLTFANSYIVSDTSSASEVGVKAMTAPKGWRSKALAHPGPVPSTHLDPPSPWPWLPCCLLPPVCGRLQADSGHPSPPHRGFWAGCSQLCERRSTFLQVGAIQMYISS